MKKNFQKKFLFESKLICENLNYNHIEKSAKIINKFKKKMVEYFFLVLVVVLEIVHMQ